MALFLWPISTLMFELFTLADITQTKARKGQDPFLVNQEQNYHTILNTIGLRANPTVIKCPEKVSDFPNFGLAHDNVSHAWKFVFDIEYGATDINLLKTDFDLIPFIHNLSEDCTFELPVFRTTDEKYTNIVFRKIDK